ncbi:MAG: hypothetical protein EOO88_07545 [Pedobacter sp.]|nr:MAG: hypothetical protein EOO88_07545 [Pedobacter sp.]
MKIWKKLLLYSVSILGLVSAGNLVIWACGGEIDPYDYYTSFFHSDVQGNKEYKAFYFTDYSFLYDDEEPADEADINAAEWAAHLHDVKPADVKKVMYKLDSAGNATVDDYLSQNAELPDSLSRNTYLTALTAPGNEPSLGYLKFAREVEPIANRSYDVWNPTLPDSAALGAAAEEALLLADGVADDFVKLRYYYQAQRLFHYGYKYKEASDVYQKYIIPRKSTSHVKGWALSLKAGEARKLGDTVLASYLFSKVFAQYPERRLQAYRNYHYMNTEVDDEIKLTKSDLEKANVYAINGFGKADMSLWDLEKVYQYQPASPMVGVLLVREINKLEQYYLTPLLSNNAESDYRGVDAKVVSKNQHTVIFNWPLVLGIVLLIVSAGFGIFVYKQPAKSKPMIGLTILLFLGGLAGIARFAFFSGKADGYKTEATSGGSFFVAQPDSVQTLYNGHIEKLRAFCTTLNSEGKYPEANIGGLANAYLYFMQNKPEEGLAELTKLDGKQLSAKLNDQKQIVKLLLSAQRLKKVEKVDENALLPALQWLNGKAAHGSNFEKTQRDFYIHVLAPAYLRQRDTAMAAIALLKSTEVATDQPKNPDYAFFPDYWMPQFWFNFMHSGPMKQVVDWREKGVSDPYLSFLASDLKKIPADLLNELMGTIYLREHQYDLAAASLGKIKNTKLLSTKQESSYMGVTQLQGDPFVMQINDYPRDYSTKGVNKVQFAREMNSLYQRVKENPKDANTLFKIGLGLYSTCVDGNSWRNISYSWSSTDLGRAPFYYYDGDYIQARLAQSYFTKARAASSDPEMKARCTFLLAKCDQKQHVRPEYSGKMDYEQYQKLEKAFDASLRTSSYFNEMKAYSGTKFYQVAVEECSYLRDFIGGNQK